MSEMREKVMTLRWWALNQACDIANEGHCPTPQDIHLLGELVDIVKDTHEIEHLAMKNAELATHAQARMCEMHPGFGVASASEHGHHDHEEHYAHKADMVGVAKA